MNCQYWKADTPEKLQQCFKFLASALPERGWRIEWKEWRDIRSLSQNAFQHVIYDEISAYLISRGRTDCTRKWVKDMLKNKFLGWEEKEFVDIKTGERIVKEVLRSTSDLDVGDAVHYTDQIIAWANDIGCRIKIPSNSDYMKYKEAQDA